MQKMLSAALAAHQTGRFDQAALLCQKVLAQQEQHPEAWHLLGLIHHHTGDHARAVELIGRAVALQPSTAAFHSNLAEAYRALGRLDRAVECSRTALWLEPDFPEALCNLGVALQALGQHDEALSCFRRAVQSRPNLAGVYRCLGALHLELGNWAEAEAALRQELRLEPDNVMALHRLAMLLGGRLPKADLAALEQRLADPTLSDDLRSSINYALAYVLDALEQYPRAARRSREANALALKQTKQAQQEYNPRIHECYIDSLIKVFDRDFFTRMAGSGVDSRRPVFIFGLPRSGTTLIAQILASHTRVCSAGELTLVYDSFNELPSLLNRSESPFDCIPHLHPAAIRQLAEQHLVWLQRVNGVADRVVNKMPDNYLFLGLMAALFPNATFIHCRRDLRDVATSCWMTPFLKLRWSNTPEHLGTRFEQYLRLMDHWRNVLPVPLLEVHYENTVADLEGVSRQVLAACGLDWTPACLEFHRARRPVRTASLLQVRQPLYQRAVARWKHYENDLADIYAQLPGEKA